MKTNDLADVNRCLALPILCAALAILALGGLTVASRSFALQSEEGSAESEVCPSAGGESSPAEPATTAPVASDGPARVHALSVEELIDWSDLIIEGRVQAIWLTTDTTAEAGITFTPYVAVIEVERSFRNPNELRQVLVHAGERLEVPSSTPRFVSDNVTLREGSRYRLFLVRSPYPPFSVQWPSLKVYALTTLQGLLERAGDALEPRLEDAVSRTAASLDDPALMQLVGCRPPEQGG